MANLTCPHCGTANRIGSNFCNKCGTDLREEEPTGSQTDKINDNAPIEAISRAAALAAQQIRDPQADESQTTPQGSDAGDRSDAITHDISGDAHGDEPDANATKDVSPTPLPPLFDLGLASMAPSDDDSLLLSQPWLQASDDESPDPPTADAMQSPDEHPALEKADDPLGQAGVRLVSRVQGLLDPLNITSDAGQADDESDEFLPTPVIDELSAQQIRHMRRIMSEEPVLAAQIAPSSTTRHPSLHIPWIFLLIGLAIVLPIFGVFNEPIGTPQEWTGTTQAYAIIESLPFGSDVQVYWAYDPATSGELDLVAQPVIRHLLDRRANLTFVSLLPGGPATVRRLVTKTLATGTGPEEIAPAELSVAMRRITVRNFYLTGGASVLPLLGQGPELLSMPADSNATIIDGTTPPGEPALALIMAARTEDVQHWLELVQTVNARPERTTAVAVTGAGVYPMVLPYLDSGQLSGLVSGFDGADTYQQLRTEPASEGQQMAATVQVIAQNWAHLALLFVLLMGNVAGFLSRDSRTGEQ